MIPSSQGLPTIDYAATSCRLSVLDPSAPTSHLDGDYLGEVCRIATWTTPIDIASTRLCGRLRVEDLCLRHSTPDAGLPTCIDLRVEELPCVDITNDVCSVELAESPLGVVVIHVFILLYLVFVLHEKETV